MCVGGCVCGLLEVKGRILGTNCSDSSSRLSVLMLCSWSRKRRANKPRLRKKYLRCLYLSRTFYWAKPATDVIRSLTFKDAVKLRNSWVNWCCFSEKPWLCVKMSGRSTSRPSGQHRVRSESRWLIVAVINTCGEKNPKTLTLWHLSKGDTDNSYTSVPFCPSAQTTVNQHWAQFGSSVALLQSQHVMWWNDAIGPEILLGLSANSHKCKYNVHFSHNYFTSENGFFFSGKYRHLFCTSLKVLITNVFFL